MAAAATPAMAQVMTTVISGVVGANNSPDPDVDALGLFGPAGASLNGLTLRATFRFDSSVMFEGGAAPGYSAWVGPSGSCAITIGGVAAKPSIEKLTAIDSNRIYLYSDYQGTWELSQFTQNTPQNGAPSDTCGITIASTKHHFVPSADLVQSFSFRPPSTEQADDSILLDITVNGVRETVTADVVSVKYAP